MTHMAIRIRREDQNRLLRQPLDEWRTHTFPTVDALVRFGIQSARDGWEVVFPDGTALRKAEEAPVGAKTLTKVSKSLPKAGKPLPKVAPSRPKLFSVPANTEWRGNYLTTTMADGLEMTWDRCGVCAQGLMTCTCSQGISAPNSVRYISHKTAGVVAGQKWEDIQYDPRQTSTSDRKPAYVQPWRENRTSGGKSLPKPASKSLPTTKRLTKVAPPAKPLPNRFADVDLGTRKSLERITRQAQQREVESAAVEITEQTKLSDFDNEAKNQAAGLLGALQKRLTKPQPTKSLPKSLPVKSAGKPLPRKKA